MLIKEQEILQPDAFCEHTMQQNATAAPDTLAGFKREGKGKRGEGHGERGRERTAG